MTTDERDLRNTIAAAIHDGPSAVLELAETGMAPHSWEDCPHKLTYLGDADSLIGEPRLQVALSTPPANDVREVRPRGAVTDAEAERAAILADLREWSRPLGDSPAEDTLRLVIARIEARS